MSLATFIAGNRLVSFDTMAQFLAAGIPAPLVSIDVAGFAAAGDCSPMRWTRMAAAPGTAHPGQKQTADGAWWQIETDSRNALDARWFGVKCDLFTNDIAALTDARDAAVGLGYADINIASPGCVLGTVAAPVDSWTFRGIWINGQDANRTLLMFPGNSGVCLFMDGAGGVTGGGVRRITLWAPPTRSTGQALRLDGGAAYQPDETAIQDLKITGQGGWDIPLFLSGFDRALGSPPGLRKVSIKTCFIGRGTSLAAYFSSVEELNLDGFGTYGGVVPAGNNIQVTSDEVTTRSSVVNMVATNCQGTLIIDRAQLVDAQGNFNAVNAGVNSVRCTGRGFCSSVTNAGTGNSFTGFV